jgi:hypothetical protein
LNAAFEAWRSFRPGQPCSSRTFEAQGNQASMPA